MKSADLIVGWHPAGFTPVDRYCVSAILLFLALLSWTPISKRLFQPENAWIVRCVGAGLFAIGYSLLITYQTVFDANGRTVRRQRLFLGRFCCWQRSQNFDQFSAIKIERSRGSQGDDDTIWVYLLLKDASRLSLTYDSVNPKTFARRLADVIHRIVRITNLPVHGEEHLAN